MYQKLTMFQKLFSTHTGNKTEDEIDHQLNVSDVNDRKLGMFY